MEVASSTTRKPRRVRVTADAGRVCVRFPAKPAAAVREYLKRHGAQCVANRRASALVVEVVG